MLPLFRHSLSVTVAIAVAYALTGIGCGSDAASATQADAAVNEGGFTTDVACTKSSDCVVPPTTPADCATAKCDILRGICLFIAKDNDGDGDPAAHCVSSNGVRIQLGGDCNDDDPNLSTGHAEPCSLAPDGGTPPNVCKPGQKTCLSDGTESTCGGTLVCAANQTCVNELCVGSCGPGQTQCSGNAVQTCDSGGNWSAPVPCTNSTCQLSGDGGTSASCVGSCTPGTVQCSGTGAKQTCGADGSWGPAVDCVNQTCVGGACQGVCAPAQTQCQGNAVQTCTAQGVWSASVSCGNKSCTNGACVGSCAPGQVQCSGKTPQTCSATGTWVSGTTCPFVCTNGACSGICSPGATQCSGNSVQTCNAGGQWGAGQLCPAACVSGACTGVCVPGSTQCCGNNGAGTICGATASGTPPFYTPYPQTCSAAGQWVSGTGCASCDIASGFEGNAACGMCGGIATCETPHGSGSTKTCGCP